MRIALCVRHQKAIYRLVWLNESAAGIYVGVLGSTEDAHVSYHADGARHTKIGPEYINRFSDAPISSFAGFKQLDHFSLSLTKNWFNSKTVYAGDERTESIVLLDERLLSGADTLALDVWLTGRRSEFELLDVISKHVVTHPPFTVVGQFVSALENFPQHKIALTLRSARSRSIATDQLIFHPAKGA